MGVVEGGERGAAVRYVEAMDRGVLVGGVRMTMKRFGVGNGLRYIHNGREGERWIA